MKTYTAYFRTDADWADKTFRAKTPGRALAKARAFHKANADRLLFQAYDGGHPVNEIEISGPEGDELAVWREDELCVRLAAYELLAALAVAVERIEINNHQGEEDQYIALCKGVLAKARPQAD